MLVHIFTGYVSVHIKIPIKWLKIFKNNLKKIQSFISALDNSQCSKKKKNTPNQTIYGSSSSVEKLFVLDRNT